LGVSSQDVQKTTAAIPGENGQIITTTGTSKTQGTTPTSKPGNPPSTSAMSTTTVQGTTPTSKPGNPPPAPVISTTAVQGTTPTSKPGNPPSTPTTHASSPTTTPGGLGTAVAPPPSVEGQGSQPSDQLTSTAASTGIPTSSLPPGLKDYGVSSPTSVAKQPHSSPSSPVHGLASSTRPGSIDTSGTPFDGSVSPTTSKASLSLPSGSINKVSEAATTPTLGTDARSVSTKPARADQSPASAQPSAPGDQMTSSSPGHQHPDDSFQNEVLCKDQVQNNWPTIYLKEAKTCAEWKRTASIHVSFFESFCSTGQHVFNFGAPGPHVFNASRETCTVVLSSREPCSQHWAVQAVVHLPLDPEKVLEELKEKKDKLEEVSMSPGTVQLSYGCLPTIIPLAGSLLLIAAIYGCCHQRFSQKKDQQRLTEELQTMENGYHDNPTLEVMETSSEMQEKKVNLNGELGDSWIVPLDTLMKEDLEEEEDTHL
ncbi:Podocalyxin, partial [Fulmarus glacialis]